MASIEGVNQSLKQQVRAGRKAPCDSISIGPALTSVLRHSARLLDAGAAFRQGSVHGCQQHNAEKRRATDKVLIERKHARLSMLFEDISHTASRARDGNGQMQSGMIENRRLRFATIDGIERADLPLAAEVWLEDLRNQSWISREILKLSTLLMRYIANPDPETLLINHVERACQLDSEQALEALRLMQMYGAVEAYSCEDEALCVSLNLTLLHRLKVLDVRQRFNELRSPPSSASGQEKWTPDWPIIYPAEDISKAG